MTRVLVISSDTVDLNMGGMGIRSWEIARALAKHCQVTLAVPNSTDLSSENLQVVSFDLAQGDLKPWTANMDVIVLQGAVLHLHPYLRDLGIPIAVDLYIPTLLESLVWHDLDNWNDWIPAYEEYLRVQSELLRAGDFFFCASDRQRDYWLGWLHALKRVNPHTFREDPTFRRLIDLVPFGLSSDEPVAKRPVMKGVLPGIAPADKVILWSGGLWDWLDPLTLIRAVAELVPAHPELKLYFMGTKHPNAVVSGMSMPDRAMRLCREMGLLGKVVFFGEWTAYADRENYLLEADLSVVSHPMHVETRFSFRTRVLDCIWARLPLVVTEGDLMADWVRAHNLGVVVPPEDVNAMADAILRVIEAGRPSFSASFDSFRGVLAWDQVVTPLLQFCLHPCPASDKTQYLTETERMAQSKDTFLEQVIRDKDRHLEQVVEGKERFLEQVIMDKDRFLDQVVKEKDAYWEGVCREKQAQLESFRAKSQELDRLHRSRPIRVYLKLRRIFRLD